MNDEVKENRFLDALEALFTGAEVEGESGFINLMRMKRGYFKSLRPTLMEKIDSRAGKHTAFREELFDKLYTFFSRYFCESGSIYFRHLPAFSKTYERVYSSDEDVALSWKTHMLYYVKSDILVRSMPVTLADKRNPAYRKLFYFDASQIEHKRNNERREFVFEFANVEQAPEGNVVRLTVSYSQKGRKTNLETIIKKARNAPGPKVTLNEDDLQQAIRVFKRQTEADFFINKDARGFLREQFDLWMYQYMFQEKTIFEQQRLDQLQAIQHTAYDIIDFIAQFEDELRRVWEKPKFVRNVNYVITLNKLSPELLLKVADHEGISAQIREWQELGMVGDKFVMTNLIDRQTQLDTKSLTGKYRFLPLDTNHFKSIETEILIAIGDLEEVLDGELIHSDNWQALNALRKRFKAHVKCIYIDPPFNLEGSDQFDYRTNYKDACWATMLENRLQLAHEFLTRDGAIFLRCDYNGNWIVRGLLDKNLGQENFKNEIVVNRFRRQLRDLNQLNTATESLFLYGNSPDTKLAEVHRGRICTFCGQSTPPEWRPMHSPGIRKPPERIIFGNKLLPPRGRHWTYTQQTVNKLIGDGRIRIDNDSSYIDLNGNRIVGVPEYLQTEEVPVDDDWTDLKGYAFGSEFSTENAEELIERVVKMLPSGSDPSSFVFDFFAGSGTTQAVAQKLGHKWIGVEMGDHFHTIVLPRLKKVISGHQSGISKNKDVNYKGGGVFKYYTLEQYEETLRNSRYEDGEQLELDSMKSPFEQYTFFGDDKLAHAVKPSKNGNLEINLQDLYPDIDVAESLSNILGKPIRHRSADTVTFTDGITEKTNPASMTEEEKRHFVSLLKPYLWWGA